METLHARIPLKQRRNVLDELTDSGLTAEVRPDGESDTCSISVLEGRKDARTVVARVLQDLGLQLEEEKG